MALDQQVHEETNAQVASINSLTNGMSAAFGKLALMYRSVRINGETSRHQLIEIGGMPTYGVIKRDTSPQLVKRRVLGWVYHPVTDTQLKAMNALQRARLIRNLLATTPRSTFAPA